MFVRSVVSFISSLLFQIFRLKVPGGEIHSDDVWCGGGLGGFAPRGYFTDRRIISFIFPDTLI